MTILQIHFICINIYIIMFEFFFCISIQAYFDRAFRQFLNLYSPSLYQNFFNRYFYGFTYQYMFFLEHYVNALFTYRKF